ncbi:capsular biosynthesis protein [Meridianimarinicoccus sp. MJW13]|uniref:capsular polysaccharide export protein, LipB/KpsS family n=1 Tax=Meridianimarinicoccus sp. MJW13 TaxID=2720031 RepID=UPI001868AEE9|nr:capsular biosynthesis protein [Fluviibacterium sp. MJW13]
MTYVYLKDGDPEIDSMLASVCEIGGGTRQFSDLSIRLRGYPETRQRAEEAVATAKRPPRSPRHRNAKIWIYSVQYNRFRHHFESHEGSVAVAWNGITGTRRAFMAAARDAGRPTIYLERAPLPGRVTVDPVGINQLNSLPRDAGFYRDWAGDDPDRAGPGWLALREKLQARASARADVGQGSGDTGLAGQKFIFCPLQVPDDTQIRQFSGWVRDLEHFIELLTEAAADLPEGWHLRFKEHPSSKIPLGAALERAKAAQPDRVVIDNQTDTFFQVDRSQAVITLNSSVGLQALYFEKPVIVLGEAFFRIPGIVTPVDNAAALGRVFAKAGSLDYDAGLRNAFMNYLGQVYYPEVETGPDGHPKFKPDLVLPKLPVTV